jgi:hypothetical protein
VGCIWLRFNLYSNFMTGKAMAVLIERSVRDLMGPLVSDWQTVQCQSTSSLRMYKIYSLKNGDLVKGVRTGSTFSHANLLCRYNLAVAAFRTGVWLGRCIALGTVRMFVLS